MRGSLALKEIQFVLAGIAYRDKDGDIMCDHDLVGELIRALTEIKEIVRINLG